MINLAYKLRPTTIQDVLGQDHLLAPNKPLYNMVQNKHLSSIIFYAPPGTGKNSLAQALANDLALSFYEFNAGTDDKKKLQNFVSIVEQQNEPIIIFLDEIHRLDKTKQDYLLRYVETGQFIIIGATTENPYISINPALRSRTHIFQLNPLEPKHIQQLIRNGLNYLQKHSRKNTTIEPNAITFLSQRTNGDARFTLNTLELAFMSTHNHTITIETLAPLLNQTHTVDDKDGTQHYNLLSAFQKSIRGSDVDASLYYLARLIQTGDLIAICRRLSIIAFEDVGLADIHAINLTINAIATARNTGFPEARIPLAVATSYLALAPKSNIAYKSLDTIMSQPLNHPIPNHLKDNHFKNADKLDHTGYIYPHSYPYHIVKQQYLPDALHGQCFFKTDSLPTQHEQQFLNRYEKLSKILKGE